MAPFVTAEPTAERLHEAILSNSYDLVKLYLEAGVDPNEISEMKTLGEVASTEDGTDVISPAAFIVKNSPFDKKLSGVTPVHAAVVNCYHNPVRYASDNFDVTPAIKILNKLLKHGANPCERMNPCCSLCNLSNYNKLMELPRQMTPLDLAVFLKLHKDSITGNRQARTLDVAIQIITKVTKEIMIPTTVKSSFNTMKNLLFSDDFSDVKFVCAGGTVLPAHKCVLSAGSPFFRNYFIGPWGELEEHSTGVWETSNSEEMMRGVLSFIYTGEVPKGLIDSDPAGLLSVSSQYELPDLVRLSELGCFSLIDDENIGNILQLAHLHESEKVKRGCFGYIRNNPQVLTTHEMMSLATDNTELWDEVKEAITPPSKRRRTGKKTNGSRAV